MIVVPHRRQALERLVLHATNLRIPVVEVEGGTLTSLAGFDGHQGIAVAVTPRVWASLDDILARAIERGEPPFVLALDSLEDPQNVGTLLRSAEAAGIHGVIFPTHRQAPLTPAAVKASAGAVEHLLLAPVDDLAAALADLHIRGLRVVGAEADAPLTARQSDLRGPLAIVVGSEGQGLGPAVRKRADQLMRIPMHGQIDSLNAAVAGSVLLFEAVAQRDPEGRHETARTHGASRVVPEPPRRPGIAPAIELPAPAATIEAGESGAAEDAGESATGGEKVESKPKRSRAKLTAAKPAATTEAKAKPRKAQASRASAATPPASAPAGDSDLLPGGPDGPPTAKERPPSGKAKQPSTRAKPATKAKAATAPKPRTRAAGGASEKPPAPAKPARRRTPRA